MTIVRHAVHCSIAAGILASVASYAFCTPSRDISPVGWDSFSLPTCVRVVARFERRINAEGPEGENQYTLIGRHELTVAEDWVESRYWLSHGGAGDRLETYVLANADMSLHYEPDYRRVFFGNFFGRVGSAFYGSGFTPYDVARSIIRSDQAGRLAETRPLEDGVSFHFVRVDHPNDTFESQVDVDRIGRIRDLRLVRLEDDQIVSRITFDDHEDLGEGEWFPRTIRQQTYGDSEIDFRWIITEIERVIDTDMPAVPSFPEGTRYFDSDSGQEVDREGKVMTGGLSATPAARAPSWSASAVFATIGVLSLVAAAWVYRQRVKS